MSIKIVKLKKADIISAKKSIVVPDYIDNKSQYYDRERDRLYQELFQKQVNDKSLRLSLTGGDLVYGETVWHFLPLIERQIFSEEGFTAEEYLALTKERIPNQRCSGLMNVDPVSGKVHIYEQNGNYSIAKGAPEFSTKYKHLIKTVYTKVKDMVLVIE